MSSCVVVMYDRHTDNFKELNPRNPLPLSSAKKLVFELRELDITQGEHDRYFYLLRNAEHYPPTEPETHARQRRKKKSFYHRHKDTIECFIGALSIGLFVLGIIIILPLLAP